MIFDVQQSINKQIAIITIRQPAQEEASIFQKIEDHLNEE